MFIFTMAGLSRRFQDAGYTQPKFQLPAHGHTLFEHSVIGFSRYFSNSDFLFVTLGSFHAEDFIRKNAESLGIPRDRVFIILLESPTSGQAETAALGLQIGGFSPTAPVTIFNIDTFRPNFSYPQEFDVASVDGYLETFKGHGDHWSFVKPASTGDRARQVAEVTEKIRISDYCCSGLYHFHSAKLFLDAYATTRGVDPKSLQGGERYVAPLYNVLIAQGRDIRYTTITNDEIIQCGTPYEYHTVLEMSDLPTLPAFIR